MQLWYGNILAKNVQQQQRQQQQEEAAAAKNGQLRAPAQPQTQQRDSDTMSEDTLYDRDHDEHDSRHRPQSRASQHSTLVENSRRGADGGLNHHRNNPPQISAYQHQQSQFDEPGRTADDDMW